MLKFNPTTPMLFYAKTSGYTKGSGTTTTWTNLGVLWGEWRGAFGERVTAAQALGVSDSATIRTFYHPTIYAALRTQTVVIIKNDDTTAIVSGVPNKANPNAYELWAGVDNVEEANQYMEFRVRRYEGK